MKIYTIFPHRWYPNEGYVRVLRLDFERNEIGWSCILNNVSLEAIRRWASEESFQVEESPVPEPADGAEILKMMQDKFWQMKRGLA